MIDLVKNKNLIKRCWKVFFINTIVMTIAIIFCVVALYTLPAQIASDWRSSILFIITISYSSLFLVAFMKLYDICELKEYSACARENQKFNNHKATID
jgi:uncharacterized BrkB/YihY/UPF0761 family membrane protein